MAAESNIRLDGRVAIVTGANSGIGRGIAEALAGAGAKVLVAGRREARNAEVVSAIKAAGGDALAVACDVTREDQVVNLVQKAIDAYGRLDVCVANSGGIEAGAGYLVDMDTAVWRNVIALNLDAVFLLYRESVKRMIEAGRGGSLIGISSVASIRAGGGGSGFHYAAAKGGVNALTASLTDYLGPHGIRINSILPGFIDTPATAPFLSTERMKAGVLRRIPMGRIGVPDDIGALALYLASDNSTFVTGHDFVVDGGMTRT